MNALCSIVFFRVLASIRTNHPGGWLGSESITLADTLVGAQAIVSSDGIVFWRLRRHVKAACKFRGLDNFAFDSLDCTMEWARGPTLNCTEGL